MSGRRSGQSSAKSMSIDLGRADVRQIGARTLVRVRRRAEFDANGLNRLRALREMLEHDAYLMAEAVRMAIDQGYTWEEAAQAFGITREGMHQRFAKKLKLMKRGD